MHLARQSFAVDPNEATLQVLLHTLLAQKQDGAGSTFVIGAGCSLSSSATDISTASIIRSIVEEIQGRDLPKNTAEVDTYRSFVNYWARLGDAQVTRHLSRRLAGLKPDNRLFCLRNLASNGFIGHIITTNFDLLIDRVLDGLSYNLIYGNGESEQRGDTAPLLTVIKVHGDIQKGRPIFTPFEIATLS